MLRATPTLFSNDSSDGFVIPAIPPAQAGMNSIQDFSRKINQFSGAAAILLPPLIIFLFSPKENTCHG